ncbi:lipid-A-disaccharide synthase [bacterium]|nr:lipid-A-disaccharide synthase [bacterium]
MIVSHKKIKNILIIAGETSGDMHGAALMQEMKKQCSVLRFFGIGGDRMIAQGLEPIIHASEIAFLGFIEVVQHLGFIRQVFQDTLSALKKRRPDLVVLIDYPGFNLRFAAKSKKLGFRNIYYISPQVWAWKKGRINKMAKTIDRMLVILPFEEAFYRNAGMDVHFVGHPLKGMLSFKQNRQQFCRSLKLKADVPMLGLLPGSRKQEISKLLPEMSRACDIVKQQIPKVQFVLGMAPHLRKTDYTPFMKNQTEICLVSNDTYGVMAHSDAVWVASGTATLETALMGTPMIICYKMAPFSYMLGRLLIKIKAIGLVNIIAGEKIVTELIQNDANREKMAGTMIPLIQDQKVRKKIQSQLNHVAELLGEPGASQRAATLTLEMIDKGNA